MLNRRAALAAQDAAAIDATTINTLRDQALKDLREALDVCAAVERDGNDEVRALAVQERKHRPRDARPPREEAHARITIKVNRSFVQVKEYVQLTWF